MKAGVRGGELSLNVHLDSGLEPRTVHRKGLCPRERVSGKRSRADIPRGPREKVGLKFS